NSGPGAVFGGDWAAACRATAAQSTLSLSGVSSSRVGPGDGRFRSGPKAVAAETVQDLEGTWFLGEHDGYLESHGLVHRRRLFLSPDGRDFRGEDALISPAGAATEGMAFAIRFHLHPEAAEGVQALPDGARLTLPDGVWRFTLRGGEAALEESVFFDEAAEVPRATRQIVVSGRVAQGAARVVWSIARES
ncbi:MAG: heparinase II/III-family protein, partial [Pseudomonadota bacterium]